MTETPRLGVGVVHRMRRLCTPRWQMPVCLMLLQCILLAIGNKARVEVLHFNTITRRAGKGFKSLEWSHHGSEQADGVQAVFPLLNPETHKHTHTHKSVLCLDLSFI